MVVVDRFTKFAHFVPLKHPFTAQTVAKTFVDTVVKLHGVPLSLVSDRDKIFTSAFWRELFKLLGTRLQFSTAYHPQTDGQTERVNQCLEMYLRCVVSDCPRLWRRWLPLAELWYNSTHHSSLGCTPFKALYGHEANLGAMPEDLSTTTESVAEFLADRAVQLQALKQHLEMAQQCMKLYADRRRTERNFQVGEQVLLKLQPYTQSSVANRPYPKLAYKYFGPYRVLQRIGSVAYKLELPADSQIHPVFHVSQLKAFTPDFSPDFTELPKVVELDAGQMEPEEVLDRRLVKKGNAAIPQVLVKWTSIPASAATWEDLHVIKHRFPSALAWGQASNPGGDSVTTLSTTMEKTQDGNTPSTTREKTQDGNTPSTHRDGGV
jgi:hypothetical protein